MSFSAEKVLGSIRWVAILVSGTFFGAMFFIYFSLSPIWSSMEPQEFLGWFRHYIHFVGGVMLPMLGLTAVLVFVVFLAEWRFYRSPRWSLTISVIAIFLIFPFYARTNAPINETLLTGVSLSNEVIDGLLTRWIFWHGVRALLGLFAFGGLTWRRNTRPQEKL